MSQPWPQARPAAPEPEHPKAPQTERPVLQELVSDLEASLGDNFLEEQKPAAPAEAAMAHEPRVAAQEFRSGSLDDFVSDLEASLGSDLPAVQEETAYAAPIAPAAKVAAPMAHAAAVSAGAGSLSAAVSPVRPEPQTFPTPAPTTASSMHSAAGVDLADMFGELKQELEGETASTDEDPETHYNLGVAFREMGLLDEAIGEFQKVTQASEHGHAFPQLMQTYTWLAQCFLDKGIPQAAIRWYETALKMPSIDQETRTALHYELASSLESAGNKTDALKNFLEVYGSNIDYRDVSERIKALRP
jgi:tetratricopeptide (TPR) repeat protein